MRYVAAERGFDFDQRPVILAWQGGWQEGNPLAGQYRLAAELAHFFRG